MMKGLVLELSNGHFDIMEGAAFSADGGGKPLLCYTENDVRYVVTDPDEGELYEGRIYIPRRFASESIIMRLRNLSVTVCPLETGVFTASVRQSRAVFSRVCARRIKLSAGRSDVHIIAAPQVRAEFSCGAGKLGIALDKSRRGYKIDTERGIGTITVNSVSAKRAETHGVPGGVPVSVRCGTGETEIYTSRNAADSGTAFPIT